MNHHNKHKELAQVAQKVLRAELHSNTLDMIDHMSEYVHVMGAYLAQVLTDERGGRTVESITRLLGDNLMQYAITEKSKLRPKEDKYYVSDTSTP